MDPVGRKSVPPSNSTESGMRPWSGEQRILLYSEHGGERDWQLPADWAGATEVGYYPLTAAGRGEPERLPVRGGRVNLALAPGASGVIERLG